MAPTDQKTKTNKFKSKDGNWKKSKNNLQGVKKKKKWIPENKLFKGNVNEGQGFAFKRKQKVKHEYNKLLRKEKKRNPESKQLYKEEYPEHLRHLYLAEAEKLKNEAWKNRMNRSKLRMKGQEKAEETDKDDATTHQSEADDPDPEVTPGPELTDSVTGNPEPTASSEKESREFEAIKEKRRKKKEEYLKSKQQREEAIQRYKQKKMETFQMLSKKTKKGQPNLNLQMEYLLQKIQGAGK